MAAVPKFTPLRVGAAAVTGVVLAAAMSPAPVTTAAPSSVAGMIVFLDPGHNGANDASIARQVSNGRGGTKDCQASGTATEAGYPEHTFTWDTTLRMQRRPARPGRADSDVRGNDDQVGPASTNAPRWRTRSAQRGGVDPR